MQVPPEAYPLLDLIASGESGGRYDVIYGGRTFDDYSRHPDIAIPITEGPNAGRTSTAAGKYQFLNSTWSAEAAKLGLADFSPTSQDEAAWDLASTTYAHKTGRDLLDDIRAGDTSLIRPALAGQWPSLGSAGTVLGGGGGRGSLMPETSLRTGMEREASAVPHIKPVEKAHPLGPLGPIPKMPKYHPQPSLAEAAHAVRIPRPPHLTGVRSGGSPRLAADLRRAVAAVARPPIVRG